MKQLYGPSLRTLNRRFNDDLLQIQFYKFLFHYFSKVFTNILKIYKLPKIYNKIPKYCQALVLAIIIYQANSMSQLYLASELYTYQLIENMPSEAEDSFGTKLKKKF